MKVTKRPSIKALTDFAKPYFINESCPEISYDESLCDSKMGGADKQCRKIRINPNVPPGYSGCSDGRDVYKSPLAKDLVFSKGEQYFLTLLHEIGHFIPEFDPPEEWTVIKEKLKKDVSCNLIDQLSEANRIYGHRQDSEELLYYIFWGIGRAAHRKIEDWAVEEFIRRREDIKDLVKQESGEENDIDAGEKDREDCRY